MGAFIVGWFRLGKPWLAREIYALLGWGVPPFVRACGSVLVPLHLRHRKNDLGFLLKFMHHTKFDCI